MRTDYLIAGAAALVAAIYLVGVSSIPHLMIGDPLGPKAFPIMVGIGLLVASALLAFETLTAARANKVASGALPPFDRRLVGVMVAIVFLLICFEPLGYLISVGIFLLGLTMFHNRGRWITNGLVSIGFTLVTAYVFNHLLDVRLPSGVLGL